jgi:hypothetical protein
MMSYRITPVMWTLLDEVDQVIEKLQFKSQMYIQNTCCSSLFESNLSFAVHPLLKSFFFRVVQVEVSVVQVLLLVTDV